MRMRKVGTCALLLVDAFLYIAILNWVIGMVGCAGGRDELLSKTLAGVNAAHEAFVAYDREHQAEIVDTAKTHDEGAAALAGYRGARAKVSIAFVAAYGAIAAASTDLTDEGLTKAAFAARDLVQALRALGAIR